MEFPLSYPGFEGQNLVVRSVGMLGWRPSLLKGGVPLPRRKGAYVVSTNSGRELKIRLERTFVDPLPKITIGETRVHLAPPLGMHELLWICFPLILAIVGGAVGGAIGGLAALGSGHVFRSEYGIAEKYALSALIALCALAGYVVVAWSVHLLVHGATEPLPFSSLLYDA